MELCVSLTATYGTRCWRERIKDSQYCKVHQECIEKHGLDKFEMNTLLSVYSIKKRDIEDGYQEKLSKAKNETQRKVIEKEHEKNLNDLSDDLEFEKQLLYWRFEFRAIDKAKQSTDETFKK